MKILFMIGNGFDLNLGMKTEYSDYYEYYKAINSQSKTINKLKEDISNNMKNWSDLELKLGKYTENIKSVEEFDEVFEDIGDKLAGYLQQEENSFDFSKVDREKLLKCLANPEHLLLKADRDKINVIRNSWKSAQWNVNIITFNYTQSIEKSLGEKYRKIKIGTHHNTNIVLEGVEHIHGYANNRMVMGVNDVSQIRNKSFHKNRDIIEALVKPMCNQAQKHTIDGLCKQQINSANLICIFGSSIGETDNMWWELIGNQLKRDCSIIIYDKGEEIALRRAYKKGRREREIKDFFIKKTKLTEEEKKKALNNIYIGINTDMFNIV